MDEKTYRGELDLYNFLWMIIFQLKFSVTKFIIQFFISFGCITPFISHFFPLVLVVKIRMLLFDQYVHVLKETCVVVRYYHQLIKQGDSKNQIGMFALCTWMTHAATHVKRLRGAFCINNKIPYFIFVIKNLELRIPFFVFAPSFFFLHSKNQFTKYNSRN